MPPENMIYMESNTDDSLFCNDLHGCVCGVRIT